MRAQHECASARETGWFENEGRPSGQGWHAASEQAAFDGVTSDRVSVNLILVRNDVLASGLAILTPREKVVELVSK